MLNRNYRMPLRFFVIGLVVVAVLFLSYVAYAQFQKQRGFINSNDENPLSEGWQERIDAALAPSDCSATPKPELDESYYRDKLIDTHFHISTIPDAMPGGNEDYLQEKFYTSPGVNYTMSDYVCLLQNDGTSGVVFAFFPVYPNIEKQALKLVKETMTLFPDTFVPFINAPDGDIGSVDGPTLKRMLSVYPGLFRGLGEQGLYAGAAPELPPDSERLQGVYPVVRENDLLVYFHLGEGQKESFEKVLSENPDITFIWHGDQLISCESCDKTLDDAEEILNNHPNVYYGVDELYGDTFLLHPNSNKQKVLAHLKNRESLLEQDVATWKGFIERHPDQVIWGTDRGSYLYSLDLEIGRAMSDHTRAFIARLDPSVQEKFAYKNAENLIKSRTGIKKLQKLLGE